MLSGRQPQWLPKTDLSKMRPHQKRHKRHAMSSFHCKRPRKDCGESPSLKDMENDIPRKERVNNPNPNSSTSRFKSNFLDALQAAFDYIYLCAPVGNRYVQQCSFSNFLDVIYV